MQRLTELGHRTAYYKPSVFHYLHLCTSQYHRFIEGKEAVQLKKNFYCSRPALSLMWLRTRAGHPVPMSLSQLRDGLNLPAGISSFLDELLKRKAATKEVGTGPRNVRLDEFIENEMELARSSAGPTPITPASLVDEANVLFRELMSRRRIPYTAIA